MSEKLWEIKGNYGKLKKMYENAELGVAPFGVIYNTILSNSLS